MKKAFSIAEAAETLSISEQMLRRMIKVGSVPSVRLGGRIVLADEDLEALIRTNRRKGEDESV